MNDTLITCPSCKTAFPLTESLAAPLVESMRIQYAEKFAQRESEVKRREAAILRDRESLDEQVAAKLRSERTAIAEVEGKRAREAVADEIAKAQQEKASTEEILKERNAKLAEAQKNEIELRKDRQRLTEEKEVFELDKQRAIDEARAGIREAAQKEADERSRLKLAERDNTITSLQTKLQDALRKAEQGSQQLQGEVLEIELEGLLRTKFPMDLIEPVAKGESGADVLQRVIGPTGQACGAILWESKRTKNWSDGWLARLRDNQRSAKAEMALIISEVLPKGVESFNYIDGVWIAEPRCAIPMAIALRYSLIELAGARQAGEGQQTKMALVYQYLTGPRFRHRIEAIVEKFSDMHDDLDKERKAMTRLWAKREEQIRGVIESTAGMYGDLQGIAGRTLHEIEGLTLPTLENANGGNEKTEDGPTLI
jgi:hypothetical protein